MTTDKRFIGKTCKYGHGPNNTNERLKSNHQCVMCARLKHAIYQKSAHWKQYSKEYYANLSPEKKIEYYQQRCDKRESVKENE